MLLFSKRKELVDRYYDWLQEACDLETGWQAKDCPETFVAWLVFNNLLNENKVLEILSLDNQ